MAFHKKTTLNQLSKNSNFNVWYWDVFFLTLLFSLVFFLFLGSIPLNPPDEARYAEIPREMLLFHQFIIPHLNGVVYFEKPPLSYWLVAGFMKCFGQSEWAVRGSVATLGLLGCLATYGTARKLFNRQTGILSSLILSSSLLYFCMGHFNTTDMCLSFCLTLSLYSFLLAVQTTTPKTAWLLCGYLFAGLAMMAKGLIGIAFPGMIIFLWIAITQQWRLILKMRLLSGLLIILATNLPWLLLAEKQFPGFLHFYFIVQQFERYATPIAARGMNKFAYMGIALGATFPWVFFIPQAVKNALNTSDNKDKKTLAYLMIWPVFIVVFFGFSHSVLIPYLLPITPPLAMLIAKYFDFIISDNEKKNLKSTAIILASIFLFIAIALFYNFIFIKKLTLTLSMLIPGAALLIGSVLIFTQCNRTSLKTFFACICFIAYSTYISIWHVFPTLSDRSIKKLAETINLLVKKNPNAIIASVLYYQDLPFYTKKIIYVVEPYGGSNYDELSYGVSHTPGSQQWMISGKTLRKLWCGQKPIYLLLSKQMYKNDVIVPKTATEVIDQTNNDILITNKALP